MKYLLFLLVNDLHVDVDWPVVRLRLGDDHPYSVRLLMDRQGNLSAPQVAPDGTGVTELAKGQTLLGLLHFPRAAAESNCYFLCSHPAVTVDDRSPPLSLTALDAGSILSVGERMWLVVHAWKATPGEAPASCQEELCPVCSAPLSLAPVVQCYCGKFVHLQTAHDKSQADDLLSCFLSAGRCNCGIEPTLEPQLLPARLQDLLEAHTSPALKREREPS